MKEDLAKSDILRATGGRIVEVTRRPGFSQWPSWFFILHSTCHYTRYSYGVTSIPSIDIRGQPFCRTDLHNSRCLSSMLMSDNHVNLWPSSSYTDEPGLFPTRLLGILS